MPTFIKRYQGMIHSTEAIKAGREETETSTGLMLAEFANAAVETVMAEEGKSYLIQMAISELSEGEVKDAAKKGS